ncbi:MAG: SDR family NAD(P)-dependent oxidoreductase [Methylococcales bacterium]|nr:SDR family NAD(P)-dependent oxidoreductase [Methylococcales bacterium]MCK5926528.1 SDR family NAD(P)-dependent oxidoreductase [Methylococcales bacterium]
MTLKDKVILVTGAGGGLGGTAALALAEQNAVVILLDKSIPKLEKAYDAIVEKGFTTPILYPFDLAGASEVQYEDFATILLEKYGSIQGVLHSAVEFNAFSPIANHDTKAWGDALNVNLNAPFLLTRVLLPVLQKSEHASIVFTSDASAQQTLAYAGAYGVSKVALEAFSKILAQELEGVGKIRVNTLIPGVVDSPLRKRAYPAEDKTLLPKMASLKSIYPYLFSDESIGVTAQTINAQTYFQG